MNKETLILSLLDKLLWNEVVIEKNNNPFVWKYVLVRGYNAGVWAGKLIDATKGNIVLEDARMLWRRWCKEWIGLSGIAEHWLNEEKSEVKLLETHKKVVITDENVSLFFECQPEVEKQIRNYPVAQQS